MKRRGIKNLIIDFGGVLIDLDRQRCLENFRKLGLPDVEVMLDLYHQQDFFQKYEKGLITSAEFREVIRGKIGKPVTDALICGAGNKNIRIFQKLLGRVIAVTFHGNGIYEIGLVFRRVHSFYSLLYQHIISRPVAIRRVLGDVHALLAGKGIESHHGKSIVAAVESSGIVM